MKIALDPYMFRHVPLLELPALVAELGYEYIELSPRPDFIPFFRAPAGGPSDGSRRSARARRRGRGDRDRAAALPLGGPGRGGAPERGPLLEARDRDHGRARRGHDEHRVQRPPRAAPESEGQFWRSMEELLPIFERESIQLRLEPHPDDFIEDGREARRHDPRHQPPERDVPLLRAAHLPHGRRPRRESWGTPATCSPTCTSPTPSTTAPRRDCATSSTRRARPCRVHQHLDIGQGEVDWDLFFGTLETARVRRDHDRLRVRLGGPGATSPRKFMREEMGRRTRDWKHLAAPATH